jgi:hypothetical protein
MRRFILAATMLGTLAVTGASQAAQAWRGPSAHAVGFGRHVHTVVVDDCHRRNVEVIQPRVVYQPEIVAAPLQVPACYQPGLISISGRHFALQFGF